MVLNHNFDLQVTQINSGTIRIHVFINIFHESNQNQNGGVFFDMESST